MQRGVGDLDLDMDAVCVLERNGIPLPASEHEPGELPRVAQRLLAKRKGLADLDGEGQAELDLERDVRGPAEKLRVELCTFDLVRLRDRFREQLETREGLGLDKLREAAGRVWVHERRPGVLLVFPLLRRVLWIRERRETREGLQNVPDSLEEELLERVLLERRDLVESKFREPAVEIALDGGTERATQAREERLSFVAHPLEEVFLLERRVGVHVPPDAVLESDRSLEREGHEDDEETARVRVVDVRVDRTAMRCTAVVRALWKRFTIGRKWPCRSRAKWLMCRRFWCDTTGM